jgi:hypothetical protein
MIRHQERERNQSSKRKHRKLVEEDEEECYMNKRQYEEVDTEKAEDL